MISLTTAVLQLGQRRFQWTGQDAKITLGVSIMRGFFFGFSGPQSEDFKMARHQAGFGKEPTLSAWVGWVSVSNRRSIC